MPVDFSATPRGNTALKRESKSATELVGSMMNVFKSKVRSSHAPTAPPPAAPCTPPAIEMHITSAWSGVLHKAAFRAPWMTRALPAPACTLPPYLLDRPRAAAVAPLDGRRRLG